MRPTVLCLLAAMVNCSDGSKGLPSVPDQHRPNNAQCTEPAAPGNISCSVDCPTGSNFECTSDGKALVRTERGELAPRRMFSDIQEPLGTLLRLGVLTFGAGGWIGMAGLRLSLALVVTIIAMLSFHKRARVRSVGKEVDSMLAEGQSGFTDMMKGAMARARK